MGSEVQNVIEKQDYDLHAKDQFWEVRGNQHHALNRVLYSYFSLHCDGDAELIIQNAAEGHGVEAYPRLTAQY